MNPSRALQTGICLLGLALYANPAFSQTMNPFQEGTQKVVLAQDELVDLLNYADNSKAKLEEAREEAKGKSLEESISIYQTAIKQVVMASFTKKPRQELLMRYALNQALELTIGVPSADGMNTVVPGVLKDSSNQDLILKVFEDSIDLALKYYKDDRDGVEKNDLTTLPYVRYGLDALTAAREWKAAIMESKVRYAFSVKALEFFTASAMNHEQSSKTKFAEEFKRVTEILTAVQNAPSTDEEREVRIRNLRKVIRKTIEGVNRKLSIQSTEPLLSKTEMKWNLNTAVMPSIKPSIKQTTRMTFVKIPSRNVSFTMGSPRSESGRESNEVQHKVTFTYDFEMQTTPITQAQWEAVMGSNPSYFKGANLPVERISWKDLCGNTSSNNPLDCGRAEGFIKKMNDRKDGCTYRLPTEAEWEFAARGGTTTPYWFGDSSKINDFAWYDGNSGSKTHEVGKCSKGSSCANAYGLYDMAGNVWQWVSDWYGDYSGDITYHVDSNQGPSSGSSRVLRGGSWDDNAQYLRSAYRYYGLPGGRYGNVGARLVRICR